MMYLCMYIHFSVNMNIVYVHKYIHHSDAQTVISFLKTYGLDKDYKVCLSVCVCVYVRVFLCLYVCVCLSISLTILTVKY